MNGTLLWLNGWGMPEQVWSGLQSCFPGYAQIHIDLSRSACMEDFIVQARLAVRQAEFHPVFAVGWSLGGLLAQRLAAAGEVQGIALIGTTARFVRSGEEADKGWPDAYIRQMTAALKKDRNNVTAKFRRLLFPSGAVCPASESFPAGDPWTLEALLAGLAYLRSEDTRQILKQITCPVVIIHGDDDAVCPAAAAAQLADGIERSELFVLEHTGHVPFWGREPEIAELIRRMIYEQSRESGGPPAV